MGVAIADRRDYQTEAPSVPAGDAVAGAISCGDEPSWDVVGLRVTGDRVLIKADREDHAPTMADTGLYLAASLASAVEGEDAAESWFVGTVVQIGPLVQQFDGRNAVLRWLTELEDEGRDVALAEIRALRVRVENLPQEMPDPVGVDDRVCFSWTAGQQITLDGECYLILHASDVLAVLEG